MPDAPRRLPPSPQQRANTQASRMNPGSMAGGSLSVKPVPPAVGAAVRTYAPPASDIEVGDTTGFPNAVAIAATTGSGPNASATRTEAVAVGFNSAAGADYSAAFGAETFTGAAGSVAIGTDDTGAGTATSTVNEIKLGTALHTVQVIGQLRIGKSKQTTVGVAGAAAALPATPAAYLPITASDGTEYLMPVYLKP